MNDEQCRGTTKSGTRCRIRVGLVNGYCSRHRDQAGEKPPKFEKKKVDVPGEQAFPEPPVFEPESDGETPEPSRREQPEHNTPCECRCGSNWMRGLLPMVALLGVVIALVLKASRRRSG